MKNVKAKLSANITVDDTLDERYGAEPLFPHKINRVKNLLKDAKINPAAVKAKNQA